MNAALANAGRCRGGWPVGRRCYAVGDPPPATERTDAPESGSAAIGGPIDQIGQVLTSAVAAHLGLGWLWRMRTLLTGNARKNGLSFGLAEPRQAVGHRVELQVHLDAGGRVCSRRTFREISDLKPCPSPPLSLHFVPSDHGHPPNHALSAVEAIGPAERLHGGRLESVIDRVLGSAASLQCPANPLTYSRPLILPVQRGILIWIEISCYRRPAGALR
jgi:hypothetical protein